MKVSVIIPSYGEGFTKSARWFTKARSRCFRHPDYLLTAVAVLEKAGHDVQFVDATTPFVSEDELIKQVTAFGPELLVVYCTTPSIYSDIRHASKIKESNKDMKIILIGPHVSALPEETLEIDKNIDAIGLGEYDYTLRDLANGMPLEKTLGIVYRKGDQVVKNHARPLIDNLDEIPFPAWNRVNMKDYPDPGKLYPFVTIITGRGCPNFCTFCVLPNLMYMRKVRKRSAKNIVDEIEYDLKLFPNIKEFMIETDTFTADNDHVIDFCNELDKRNLKITWSCNVRTDLDISLLPIMKKHGCRMLMVGFESGVQRCLDAVRKGITVEQSRKFAEEAHKQGLIIHGCFMVGFPDETKEETRQTIEFAKSLPMDTLQISGITAYPGTPIYRWAKSKGYIIPKDWTEFVSPEREQITILNYPQYSKKEMDEMIDVGLKEFYQRPMQMLRMVLNMRSIGDIKRKMFGFKSYLNYFRGKKK